MRILISTFIAVLVLAGCSGIQAKTPDSSASYRGAASPGKHSCVAKKGPNCSAKVMWQCPDGFEDACNQDFNGIHRCVAKVGPGCRSRIAWGCGEGFVNGCDSGATKRHECKLEGSSNAGCEQEFVLVCPEGFKDSCLSDSESAGPGKNE